MNTKEKNQWQKWTQINFTAFSFASSGRDFDPRTRAFSDEELKPQPMIKKSRKQFVPDELKDDKYWARRRKNNIAAKRSRDARRQKENQIAMRARYLEKEVIWFQYFQIDIFKQKNVLLSFIVAIHICKHIYFIYYNIFLIFILFFMDARWWQSHFDNSIRFQLFTKNVLKIIWKALFAEFDTSPRAGATEARKYGVACSPFKIPRCIRMFITR